MNALSAGRADCPLDAHDFVAISLGMAAGHIHQARTGQMHYDRLRDGRKGRFLPPPPKAVLELEHIHCACAWLQRAAFYRALELV